MDPIMTTIKGVVRAWDDDDRDGTYKEIVSGQVVYERPYNQTEKDDRDVRMRADTRSLNKQELINSIAAGIVDQNKDLADMLDRYNNATNAELLSANHVRKIMVWQYQMGQKLVALARIVSDSVDTTHVS